MELPLVNIVMSWYMPRDPQAAFARWEAAKQSMMSLRRYLEYPGPLRLIIADDGSDNPSLAEAMDGFIYWPLTISNAGRLGVGGAYNAAVELALQTSDIWLYLDDSFQLRDRLELSPWVRILGEDPRIGSIQLMEPRDGLHSGVVYGWGGKMGSTAPINAVLFAPYGYVNASRPALYHRRFRDYYGPDAEGTDGFGWEVARCDRYNERLIEDPSCPVIVHALHDPWLHTFTVELGGVKPGDGI